MNIGGEECELVTDFATLRAGMIVLVKTNTCSKHRIHRRLLVHFDPRPYFDAAAKVHRSGPSWDVVPACRPRACIGSHSVAEGRVYRVVDPLLDAQTTERNREAVRT